MPSSWRQMIPYVAKSLIVDFERKTMVDKMLKKSKVRNYKLLVGLYKYILKFRDEPLSRLSRRRRQALKFKWTANRNHSTEDRLVFPNHPWWARLARWCLLPPCRFDRLLTQPHCALPSIFLQSLRIAWMTDKFVNRLVAVEIVQYKESAIKKRANNYYSLRKDPQLLSEKAISTRVPFIRR